jgi:hypothetical protein
MTDRLSALGLLRFDVFTEAFTSPPGVPKTLAPRTVNIAGTGQCFAWTPRKQDDSRRRDPRLNRAAVCCAEWDQKRELLSRR